MVFFIILCNIHSISTSFVSNESLERERKEGKGKEETENFAETINCQERKIEISQIFHRNAFERSFLALMQA